MSENQQKKVQDIFKDYETRTNIKEAYIIELNVNKKTNTLGIALHSDEYIEIKEIWYFEKFLIERFSFSHIDMKIQYTEDVKIRSIEEEWRNVICYMAHKYPLMKPMLLLKSKIEVEQNIIHVKMHIKGADFLRTRKTDIELEKVIEKLLGKKYKIELEEVFEKQDEIEYEKKLKEMEEKAIEQTVSVSMENLQNQINSHDNNSIQNTGITNGIPEYNDPD